MSLETDMQEVAQTAADATKEVISWAGTIVSVNPVSVVTDGSGVAMPVKVADFVSLVEGRRCILQKIGSDVVLTHTYGGNTLGSLTVSGDITQSAYPTSVTSPTGAGSFSNISGYAAPSTPAGVVFTTPASGRSLILVKGRLINTSGTATLAYLSTSVRQGNTIGAGTEVLAPSNGRAFGGSLGSPSGTATTVLTGGRGDIFTGTPKTVYNVQAMVICTSGSANDVDAATVEVVPVA